jgi:hypothetical protein
MNRSVSFASITIAAAVLTWSARASEPAGSVNWYTIATANGVTIGHASHAVRAENDGVEILDSQEIDIEEEGTQPEPLSPHTMPKVNTVSWLTVRHEDNVGHTISITADNRAGRDWTRVDVRIDGNKALIARQTPAESRSLVVDLPASVRFDSGDDLWATWNPATTPRLEFDEFNIDAMRVEHIEIEKASDSTPDPQSRLAAVRKRYFQGEFQGVTRVVLDSAHRVVEVSQPMFGVSLMIKTSDRDTALAPHQAFRPLTSAMVKSPFIISSTAAFGHIRYRFSFRDGVEFALPETSDQRVSVAGGTATVDICTGCGPGLSTTAEYLADARKPTPWLQSDAPEVKAIADPVAAKNVSDATKMNVLLERAQPYIRRIDFTGHYSALETLKRRSADCTDAAVLLAALGRAAGIPTRVVNGLVYSHPSYHGVSNVFMPHSWTLAYVDGRWRSFDLALDAFDSTHIALTVGDGDEQSVLASEQRAALLQWDNMAEIRTAPAN